MIPSRWVKGEQSWVLGQHIHRMPADETPIAQKDNRLWLPRQPAKHMILSVMISSAMILSPW